MARLASQEKMGYYPTPVEIVQKIKQILQIPQQARLIDTCCGEGEALALVAKGTGAITYGVELDKERYKVAKQRLDHVLWCDALNELICTKEAFSLLWLNPPYDYDEAGEQQRGERLEMKFLKKHFPLLAMKGVLVLIVPLIVAKAALFFLRTRCSQIHIFRFPEAEYEKFNQVVILAVRQKANPSGTMDNLRIIKLLRPWNLSDVTEADVHYPVPQLELDSITFRSVRLDPEEAVEIVKRSPLWKQVKQSLFTSKSTTRIRPLMPLREGHLAMLLASGMMNGEVRGKERLIIKGSVKKVQDERVETSVDNVKAITTDRYEITVRAIRFSQEPEIITIR